MKPRLTPSTWECRVALPSEWSSALSCWHQRLSGADIFDVYDFQLKQDAYPARGFWIALMDERIDAVVWLWPESAELAHVWALRVDPSLDEATRASCARQLWSSVSAWFHAQGITVFQTLVPISQLADLSTMLRLGFQKIASIERRQMAIKDFAQGSVHEITLQPIEKSKKKEFDELMEQSFVGSLDVPELNDLHSEGEVQGHAEDNSYDRYLIRHPIHGVLGVMVLQADGITGLIRYIGLIPSARSRGLAQLAASQALAILKSKGCESVELRVDERNHPAIRLYERLGFMLMNREHMLIYR